MESENNLKSYVHKHSRVNSNILLLFYFITGVHVLKYMFYVRKD